MLFAKRIAFCLLMQEYEYMVRDTSYTFYT